MSAHGKETPRQKLIGMMYLVLTAMLALNVSKEVLEGYSVVNDTLLSGNNSFDKKQKNAYSDFEKEYMLNQIEVGPFWEKAKVAMRLSAEMSRYIGNLRDELVATTEGIPLEQARKLNLRDLKRKDNYTDPTRFMIGPAEDGSKGRARQLRLKIAEYRKKISQLVGPSFRKTLKIGLVTEGAFKGPLGQRESWEFHHFYDIPLAADVPILNKMIAEVNDAELEVVNALLRESIAEDFKYDRIEAKVIPKSTLLFPGENFEAEVIVAAYDTSRSPSPSLFVMRGADSLPLTMRNQATRIPRQDGRLFLNFPASTLGPQKYAGFVSVPTHSGRERTYHFSGEFIVAQPSLTVSPTKMNVLYVGVENPVSIAVSGVPKENVQPSISAGTLRLNVATGTYMAIVPPGKREASITVNVKTKDGMKTMGGMTFRVKNLPDPTPFIAKKKEGFVARNDLIQNGRIIAKMPNDFEFEYSFPILSFKMNLQRGFNDYSYESKSENLTDEMIQEIRRTNRGQVIDFEDIVTKGPEGEKRTLPPIRVTIK
jgi:gliding motility-associated protein GldM